MISFTGLNLAQNPLYSRLFSPSTYSNALASYNQQMQQWKPYDARGSQAQTPSTFQPNAGQSQQASQQDLQTMQEQQAQQYIQQYKALMESGRAQGSMIPVEANLNSIGQVLKGLGYSYNNALNQWVK